MIFLNICKDEFKVLEILLNAIFTYIIVMISILLSAYLPILILNADVIGNMAFTFCLIIFAQIKTKKLVLSGYYAVLTMLIGMVGNTIVSVFSEFIFGVTIAYIRSNLLLFLFLAVPTFLICYFISKPIGDQLHQCYIRLSYEIKDKFAQYGLTLSILAFLLSHVNIFAYRIIDDRVLLSSINVVLITFIFFVAIIMMSTYSLSQQKQVEAEYKDKSQNELEIYIKQLENAYEEMRSFRHDHLNLLHTLMGYVNEKSTEGLKKYLTGTLDYAKSVMDKLDFSMDSLKFIHLPELKGLLSVKIAYALSQNIEVELDIVDHVNEIPINRTDLCRLVGIILDNAIEELLNQNYAYKSLKFGIIVDGNEFLIICTNTNNTPTTVEKIFDRGFTTKGSGRGLGLYNLKQICKENKNCLATAHIDGENFTLMVTIRQV